MATQRPNVLLASMPWAPMQEPSLGLSILSAVLKTAEINHCTKYFNLLLLNYLKPSTYIQIADIQGINEFLFSSVFEEHISAGQIQSLDSTFKSLLRGNHGIPGVTSSAGYFEYFLTIRNRIIPQFLDDCLHYILQNNFTVVGFTCMFDQTIASLALAKLIKEKRPETLICFGGYALEGAVGDELLRSFDCVDIISFGDGEPVINKLANYSVGLAELKQIPNIKYRTNDRQNRVISSNCKVKISLDDSPTPDYRDFFTNLREMETQHKIKITPAALSLETSRGCWWGQKSHCIFCGIDEDTLTYRQKNPAKVIEMFRQMHVEFPDVMFRLVDYILPHTYFKTVLPELATIQPRLKISCEMKSNITFEKFELLKNAGFIQVQPGIESFSSSILRKMKKGVTGIQNILTLKLGKRLGFKVDWNFLYGFPGDKIEEYQSLLQVIPLLYHFNPPNSCTNVLLTRFSPLEVEHDNFGVDSVKAHKTYEAIFSQRYRDEIKFNINNYCYIFDMCWTNGDELEVIFRLLDAQINYWKTTQANEKCYLYHYLSGDEVVFVDNRLLKKSPEVTRLSWRHAFVYNAMDTQIMRSDTLAKNYADSFETNDLPEILKDLLDRRLIFAENDKFIGLSIAVSEERELHDRRDAYFVQNNYL